MWCPATQCRQYNAQKPVATEQKYAAECKFKIGAIRQSIAACQSEHATAAEIGLSVYRGLTVAAAIRISGRKIPIYKAIVQPAFGVRTVLTNSPWTFVTLWLKRHRETEAQFYWEQAQHFYNASIGLPMQSAPLLLYYSYMNAAKALLAAKRVPFDPIHGVRAHYFNATKKPSDLRNEGVRIMQKGVVPALAGYFSEPESQQTHRLQDVLFNLCFIHRTFCLTYVSQKEMFLPIRDASYVFDPVSKTAYFEAVFASDVNARRLPHILPASFRLEPSRGPLAIRSTKSIPWTKTLRPRKAALDSLAELHKELRLDLHYIAGSQTLWYVKAIAKGQPNLRRYSATLVLAAMHRLSEICRYRPSQLSSFLESQKTWLLSEFIAMSPMQFLDEMASEITGHQFLIPNVRSPA